MMSIQERNDLVVAYLWCIDCVIHQNYGLIQAAHLDRDDVYQDLAVRLIRAVELYQPRCQKFERIHLYAVKVRAARLQEREIQVWVPWRSI